MAAAGVLALALSIPSRTSAQTTDDFQIWAAAFATARLEPEGPTPLMLLETHGRRGNGVSVHLLRPGLAYVLAPWISVWVGYTWVPSFADGVGNVRNEHNIWQQVLLQYGFDFGLHTMLRSRVEERFSDRNDGVGVRIRELVRLELKPYDDVPLGFVVWDEIFLGLDTAPDWTKGGFDENRLFVGPAVHALDGVFRVEAGYMFSYLDREVADLVSHVLMVNLFINVAPVARADAPSAPPPEG